MATHLYLAPAGHGKTAYVLECIRQVHIADPLAPITVILPNQDQVNAFRRRLSAVGGALAVSLGTFYNLYAEVLAWAGRPEPRLPEAVQYRLLRSIVMRLTDEGHLSYYAPLRDKPGFVAALRALLEELKRARIRRDDFRQAVHSLPRPDLRLLELAEIYAAYQDWLLDNGWVDLEGQGWLAALALERQPDLGRHLRLLLVDGFDEFNPTQLAVLKLLSPRAAETLITLTGTRGEEDAKTRRREEARTRRDEAAMTNDVLSPHRASSPHRLIASPRPVLRRFTRALQAVSQTLALEPEPLPESPPPSIVPALVYLEANLFELQSRSIHMQSVQSPTSSLQPASRTSNPVTFLEVQNRAEEARAALRWLKTRLVRDEMLPNEVTLIARDLSPYRPFIEEIAAEFGLTLHWREGLSLVTNPAIAALVSLLALPLKAGSDGNWSRRPVIDAWRSPYFENLVPGLTPPAADRLDAVARQGLVMQGLDQWREALRVQTLKRSDVQLPADEDFPPPDQLTPADAVALQNTFGAFVARLTPPLRATLRDFAAFVEDLIGDDPRLKKDERLSLDDSLLSPTPFGMVNRVRTEPITRSRDLAALRTFKDVLRGLVLTGSFFETPGQALQPGSGQPLRPGSGQVAGSDLITYETFYAELAGAVEGATYYLPPPEPLQIAIPVLSVVNVRGLSFRAVALIGLAEGDFPRAEREDILLREEDRPALRQAGLIDLETRLRGDEITLFYQAVTRAREKLLLCRPYLADDGQQWLESPYWTQMRRLVGGPVEHLRPEDPLPLSEVASPPELAGALALLGLTDFELPPHWSSANTARLWHGATVLRARLAGEPHGPFEGDLADLASQLATGYGPDHIWSASRLEAYGLCPHHFWLGQDLELQLRQPPAEGFDVFGLGKMYHKVLEEVYRQAGEQADQEHLLAMLPAITQVVFDQAPTDYGFRPTPLWQMQRRELQQILANTLVALAEATTGSTPLAQEQVFGMKDQPPLVAQQNGDEFRLRGFIDRVDQDSAGRLRLIDYKSGSTPIAARDLVEGRRLQIALYALAARDALDLGDIADGFYWHIGSAKASSLSLAGFEGGVEAALATALAHAFNHIAGVRAGHFPPTPPPAGCPSHCPGAKFCWRYEAKGW